MFEHVWCWSSSVWFRSGVHPMQWTSRFVSLLRTTYKLGGKRKGLFHDPSDPMRQKSRWRNVVVLSRWAWAHKNCQDTNGWTFIWDSLIIRQYRLLLSSYSVVSQTNIVLILMDKNQNSSSNFSFELGGIRAPYLFWTYILSLEIDCSFHYVSYLKHADLDVHWKGVELHGADEGYPCRHNVHQLQF